MSVKVLSVLRHSPARRARVLANEVLHSINGNNITDVLDYRFYMLEENLLLVVENEGGERRQVRVHKGEYEELGLEFETYLMDKQHTCKNKCVFCFIDQMPPNMRESLYVKDDDARMSFLFGNYITLTNLCDNDIERIIKMRISPVNISVHTTNPRLRVQMMKNPMAGEALRYLTRLAENDIKINTQLVLCPNINDGDELLSSIKDLARLYPAVQSIACVPVGLTKYREGLEPLQQYTKNGAAQVIKTINDCASLYYKQYGDRIAYPADEFFLLAGEAIPNAEYYGEFNQLENGVGLLALLRQEFFEALHEVQATGQKCASRTVTIATGVAAGGFIKSLVAEAMARLAGLNCKVEIIQNVYFGENITVSGLITGTDLVEQLSGKPLGDEVFITSAMLRHEQDKFLDDYTPLQVAKQLGVKLTVVDNDGGDLLYKLLGGNETI